MQRFSITTLGCKVNQYDGACIAAALARAGLQPADPDGSGRATAPPDLVVINTCCVTATAMRKSRQRIRRAVRRAPEAVVFVTGCYTDYDARRIASLLEALGVGPDRMFLCGHRGDLAANIQQVSHRLTAQDARKPETNEIDPHPPDAMGCVGRDDVIMKANRAVRRDSLPNPTCITTRKERAVKENLAPPHLGPIDRFPLHQRAFVKVQDGCDAFCTYCIVPFTRARVWSRTIEEVHRECAALVAAGHKEIVLCGVFLGAFGRATTIRRRWDGPWSRLPDLVRRVAGIEGLWRVRLSSLEPGDVTEDLLGAFRELGNAAPHFHLPLQSGSPRILRRMNRQYTPDEFYCAVDRIRSALDRPAITTDVIVGFPGETDEDFAATLEMARQAGFAKIHAFPFSPVQRTAAWTFRHEAPPRPVTKRRMAELTGWERQLARAYRLRFLGENLEALVERPRDSQARSRRALTDRYLTVLFTDDHRRPSRDLTGQIVNLRIQEVCEEGLVGTLVEAP
ncbi:MAG TPA: MiaB/RimO family radical SAM methylthiotransferase [Phycisphaerae bacterium]|nr:MiaB/RimO family radical SAM methylthiotransferase [Phycisphaerae bacterium]